MYIVYESFDRDTSTRYLAAWFEIIEIKIYPDEMYAIAHYVNHLYYVQVDASQ